jgi:cyclic pyranopterin phosphate synthase
MEFTHFKDGKAIMVDVGDKSETKRKAIATGYIQINNEIMRSILDKNIKKGDVLGVARVAGIMAVKRTWELIPMCHPLLINGIEIDFNIDEKNMKVYTTVSVSITGKTGVEMEALQGVSTTLLTIYDMCKSVDKGMKIGGISLLKKTGGKSGTFINPNA